MIVDRCMLFGWSLFRKSAGSRIRFSSLRGGDGESERVEIGGVESLLRVIMRIG